MLSYELITFNKLEKLWYLGNYNSTYILVKMLNNNLNVTVNVFITKIKEQIK